MNVKKELWSVEWSEKQQCFHVDFLINVIQKNAEEYFEEGETEWMLIGVFHDAQKAHKFVEEMREARGVPTLSEKLSSMQKPRFYIP